MGLGGASDVVMSARRASQSSSAAHVFEEIMRRGGILADRGRAGVLRMALQDGSSVVCMQCGAVVAQQRMMAHQSCWCPMAQDGCRGHGNQSSKENHPADSMDMDI